MAEIAGGGSSTIFAHNFRKYPQIRRNFGKNPKKSDKIYEKSPFFCDFQPTTQKWSRSRWLSDKII